MMKTNRNNRPKIPCDLADFSKLLRGIFRQVLAIKNKSIHSWTASTFSKVKCCPVKLQDVEDLTRLRYCPSVLSILFLRKTRSRTNHIGDFYFFGGAEWEGKGREIQVKRETGVKRQQPLGTSYDLLQSQVERGIPGDPCYILKYKQEKELASCISICSA